MSAFRRRYGTGPVHLLAHLIALPAIAWAILQVLDFRGARDVVVWFVAALLLHDLVLVPAYSALDRVAQKARLGGVVLVNYVRTPAVVAGLTGLVFCGVITGKSDGAFRFVSGRELEGYAERYLLLCAGLFALSGLLLARELRRPEVRERRARAADEQPLVRGW